MPDLRGQCLRACSSPQQALMGTQQALALRATADDSALDECKSEQNWYAIHTYPRHEKSVARELQRADIEIFLPMVKEVHRWSDRRKKIAMPLFSCYVFARLLFHSPQRFTVLMTTGVIGIVGAKGGTSIPDGEIDAIRSVLTSNIPIARCNFSRGQRVRVRGGVLDGVEGVLVSDPGERRLLISVQAINQALSISVEGYELQAA